MICPHNSPQLGQLTCKENRYQDTSYSINGYGCGRANETNGGTLKQISKRDHAEEGLDVDPHHPSSHLILNESLNYGITRSRL